MALRALAEVTGGPEAVPLLREAVAVLERTPARREHARALTDLAAATGEGGREAFELALRLGATALAERARQQLGIAPPPRLALTAVQLRVCCLAAGGRTDREIAEALFVTEKAVADHLAQACRTLGAGSRAQLAAALD
jgi:DNA-binding CsgD family transcriptional regulator